MLLQNKVAWITGGAQGIGRATALRFAREGASVIVADIDEDCLSETIKTIESEGGEALAITGSVKSRADVDRMVEAALGNFGRLDILINNAGITRDALVTRMKDGDLRLMTEAQWDDVLEVNLKGAFLCAQAASVPMIRQKSGRIVNTASVSAFGNIGQANYAASKAGVIGLTRTLAREWARFGIAVNCVAPGAVRTQMTAAIPEKIMAGLLHEIPFGRLAEPEEIASVHLFLASEMASYVTGQVLLIDGGLKIGV